MSCMFFAPGRMARPLSLLLALSVPAHAADPSPAPTAPGAIPPDTEPAEVLPPGVVQRGTLANPKLLRDTALGVSAVAGTLGIKPIEKALPYVVEMPQGEPGSRVWTERWIVSQGTKSAAIDIRFQEDGSGAATWSIELPEDAPGRDNAAPTDRGPAPQAAVDAEQQPYVAAAQEFVRQAQAGDVDRMIGLTSPQTIRNSGRQQLKESYRTYVVPRFKGATVRWADAHVPATDETGNRGWDVVGNAEGAEAFSFFISVMKEKGKYVVVTIGRHEPDDKTP
jgi:hypothetical protein